MSVEALIALSDEALAGLAHRRLDLDLVGGCMRHEAAAGRTGCCGRGDPYDAARDLRLAWSREDFPDQDPAAYLAASREVALRRGARVLAVHEARAPVGFAQLERDGAAAEITRLYVHPDHRRRGRGTALTRAAIDAAEDVRDLWIVADEEASAKEIYARLGFRATWKRMEFLRLP